MPRVAFTAEDTTETLFLSYSAQIVYKTGFRFRSSSYATPFQLFVLLRNNHHLHTSICPSVSISVSVSSCFPFPTILTICSSPRVDVKYSLHEIRLENENISRDLTDVES
jgi:hypothetical protein